MSILGLALIPAVWFTIPALTSHSWFIAGDLAFHLVETLRAMP